MANLYCQTKLHDTLNTCRKIAMLVYLIFFGACESRVSKYDHPVGFIDSKKAVGDRSFKTCDTTIYQYYNSFPHAGYKFGKKALRDSIMRNFVKVNDESGYLTIRFIINCSGQSGRYEIIENDNELRPTTFSEKLKSQFLDIIINHLKSWTPLLLENRQRDSYMYLTFKMENGEIIEILP